MVRPLPIFTVTLLLTLALGMQLRHLRFDNTPESWLPADSEGMVALKEFREKFGDGSMIVAAMRGERLPEQAAEWAKLRRELKALPGVAHVIAPPFVADEEEGPRAPLSAYLVSEDGRHAALLVLPKEGMELAERGAMVERLQNLLGDRFALAGTAVITHDLDTGSRESLMSMGPFVAIALSLVLFLTTRQWWAVGAVLVNIGVASVMTLGALSLAGRPLNLVVVILPAILAVVNITQAMHTLSAFRNLPAGQGWPEALRQVWRPSLYCNLTTMAGFLSLATSAIVPVRDLGLFAALGVMISFGLSFTLLPALLGLSKSLKPRGAQASLFWTREKACSVAARLQRWRWGILALALLVVAVSVAGISRIRVDSHILEFFPASHRVPANYFSIEKDLLGLTPIDFVFSGPREVLLKEETLGAYRNFFEETLRREPLASQVASVLLEPTRGKKLELVMTAEELREALEDEDLPETLGAFLKLDGDQIALRTTILTATASTNEVYELIERLKARLQSEPVSLGVKSEISGVTPLLIEGQVLLLKTQIESFGTALVIVSLAILIAFRSARAMVVILIPNLIPIAVTLGVMGWSGIALNTATVTVAGIALGLIVDDSIHYYHRYKACLSNEQTLHELAKPIAITSIAVACGFALFVLSPFLPTVYFGGLLALTASTALVSVLGLLPLLVGWGRGR